MKVTLTRKQLAEILRHRDTGNIRQAVKRGQLFEDEAGKVNIKDPANKAYLKGQISAGKRKGFLIDLDLEESTMPDSQEKEQETTDSINKELKKARTELVKEQTVTAQLNREVSFGNYLKTSHVTESVKIYMDTTMNVANTNLSNVATKFCQKHGIKNPEEIVKIKAELTEALNNALEDGRKEVLKCIDRMVEEQIEKFAIR